MTAEPERVGAFAQLHKTTKNYAVVFRGPDQADNCTGILFNGGHRVCGNLVWAKTFGAIHNPRADISGFDYDNIDRFAKHLARKNDRF